MQNHTKMIQTIKHQFTCLLGRPQSYNRFDIFAVRYRIYFEYINCD